MSSSIPIPSRPSSTRTSAAASFDEDEMSMMGTSLPVRSHHGFLKSPPLPMPPTAYGSQDDLSTSWPPRPSVELVSRSARKWMSVNRKVEASFARRRDSTGDEERVMRLEPWDFSEVALATDEMRSAFQRGNARAERPPREGVCGTYFIRGGTDGGVMCVFKPVDEEAADIEMSPTPLPASSFGGFPFGDGSGADFTLGPAHGASSPVAQSPISLGYAFHRTRSLSSDSDLGVESHSARTQGFHAGEGAYKEVAAYLLDHDRFARVPQTALATCQFSSDVPEKNQSGKHIRAHSITTAGGDGTIKVGDGLHQGIEESTVKPTRGSRMRTKMGALQVFVANVGDADDFGPGVFDKDQVHRIAILDIRTLNHDRHGGNILVTKSASPHRRYNLVPIDHGYILPETVQTIPWPVWMDWPMIREPVSERVKTHIEHLDPEAESNILDEELEGKLSRGSLNILKIATIFLQKGVAAGLSLYEIGLLMYTRRETPHEVSELAKIIMEAEEAVDARDRNFSENECTGRGQVLADDHLHRRHQSMSTLHVLETFNDDYFIRYARKRIQDVISTVVAKKFAEHTKTVRVAGRPPRLARSRSIPNFGIGGKPLHTFAKQIGRIPAPTPASSPVSSGSVRVSATKALEAQILQRSSDDARQPPIQIPINDRNIRRIEIPEPRALQVADMSYFHKRSISMPVGGESSEGSENLDQLPSGSSGSLPPLFKSARKSSPVAPQDLAVWGGGSS